MKEYTNEDLKTFERNERGWLICPSGDYTAIKVFPANCLFGDGCGFEDECTFGKGCSFGENCSFGEGSDFGAWSSFGERSSFGAWCDFDEGCYFDKVNNFGEWSSFGEGCVFGDECIFGERCTFSERCSFGENCSHEGLTNSIYVAIDRIGSMLRKTYFFKAEEGYFVRAGCFFGTLDEFKTEVHETHDGTIHETTYLLACDLAVKLLDSQYEGR